jgi:hypothetical protein
LPGVPSLYSFDEVGAEFPPYAEPAPLKTKNPELREFHKRWIHLRRTLTAMHGDGFIALYVGKQDEAFVVLRFAGTSVALIALNFSEHPAQITVPIPKSRWRAAHLREASTGETLTMKDNTLRLDLPSWDARVFMPD